MRYYLIIKLEFFSRICLHSWFSLDTLPRRQPFYFFFTTFSSFHKWCESCDVQQPWFQLFRAFCWNAGKMLCPAFISKHPGFHHGSGSMRRTVRAERKRWWKLRQKLSKVPSLESCVKVCGFGRVGGGGTGLWVWLGRSTQEVTFLKTSHLSHSFPTSTLALLKGGGEKEENIRS